MSNDICIAQMTPGISGYKKTIVMLPCVPHYGPYMYDVPKWEGVRVKAYCYETISIVLGDGGGGGHHKCMFPRHNGYQLNLKIASWMRDQNGRMYHNS